MRNNTTAARAHHGAHSIDGIARKLNQWVRRLVVAPLVIYARFISPATGERCKYYPTCSAYAIDAIRIYGVCRGSILVCRRLLRCNPFSHGGVDHPEDQQLFKSRHISRATTGSRRDPNPYDSNTRI